MTTSISISITEKIVHSDAFEVNLYKEGVFWRGYEQSAYAIWLLRAYQPKKEKIKKVRCEVVNVGFPAIVLEDILSKFEVVERKEKQIRLKTREPIDSVAFEAWKKELPTFIPTCENCNRLQEMLNEQNRTIAPQTYIEPTEAMVMYNKVLHYDLSNSTPMECMAFLSELKKVMN